MDDAYYQLTQHRRRAHHAVRYECEREYLRAAQAWHLVAHLALNPLWQQWARLRADICLKHAEEKLHAKRIEETRRRSVVALRME